ncbi:heme lyase CcmF/NrfE family subunit [Aggregicoccus sp. 17bor-14]|uniref:heme lyase CcmF/NrfE family subunit n=1 Tax=Myxococcaceae TaxID=31 RepID=UPI00129C420E|nr:MULTISPECIES: heme lyase CcmF/NrfE family subunit [Myxococcaceae]MBF5041087.1 heme lyase CcmF/NrfE family subunit [Simulacricoccus sp. 17bor-14]MRI86874.1 heme lyase CcmF/NrfE family subunit [Aggregicoccus sp. 17bor-14]
MNGLVGYGLILAGLAFATFGAIVGLTAGMRRSTGSLRWVRACVWGFFLCMAGSNLTMVHALVTHDFSVRYVAQVGSRATPLLYTVVSLWSALEGSILFWGLIMGSYVLAFMLASRREEPRHLTLALGTMLGVGIFFAFLIAGPANPWSAVSPVPPDGPGPNALLQNHFLMVIHPPMLYLGYVGMTVPFGVAVAALLGGELRESWMAPLRRWTLIAWTFLSVGIILGSWWAYAVLGWGGYWAWDPVENASFLPWLTATAFIHSTMVQERKRMLKLWTISLALASFVLTILGTFMTRSGIFNSVHSFTQSEIGPTFLVFIAFLLVVCIALLAARGHLLVAEGYVKSLASREASILVNNLVFVAITFTVLIGTLYPLISEAVRGVRVSVGEPYFNKMAVPGGIAVLFLMGVGPMLPWGSSDPATVRRQFVVPSLVGLAVTAACYAAGLRGFYPLLTFGLAGFVTLVTLRELALPVRVRMRERKEGLVGALFGSATKARRRFGGYIVHLAIVLIIVAVAASSSYVTHATATVREGQSFAIGGYSVKYLGLTSGREPRRTFVATKLEVTTPGGKVEPLAPRMNYYERMTDPVGSPAVRDHPGEDLYVSLLAFSEGGATASFNAWVFPLVSWIWWSIPLLVLGSLISLWPSRRARTSAAGSAGAQVASVPSASAERGAA